MGYIALNPFNLMEYIKFNKIHYIQCIGYNILDMIKEPRMETSSAILFNENV